MRNLLLMVSLGLLLVGNAWARPSRQGIANDARDAVKALYQKNGWLAPQHVSAIAPGKKRGTWDVAVVSGKQKQLVRVVTLDWKKDKAVTGLSKLATQKEALATALEQIKSYQPNVSVGARLKYAGLSDSGDAYRFVGKSKEGDLVAYVTFATTAHHPKGVLNNVEFSRPIP